MKWSRTLSPPETTHRESSCLNLASMCQEAKQPNNTPTPAPKTRGGVVRTWTTKMGKTEPYALPWPTFADHQQPSTLQ